MYTVNAINKEPKMNPKTGKMMYPMYAEVTGPGGTVQKVALGFKSDLKAGDVIPNIERNKFGEMVPSGGLIANTGGAVLSGVLPAPYASAKSRGVFPIPKDSGEFSIIRQSALKAAIETIHNYEVRSTGEVLKPMTLAEYLDKVLDVSYIFADFSSGHREVKEVAKLMKADVNG